jgi:hypothetical protein
MTAITGDDEEFQATGTNRARWVMVNSVKRVKSLIGVSLLVILSTSLYGQYMVGDTVSTEHMNISLSYCANETGTTSLGDLLTPPVRALWINFFASW